MQYGAAALRGSSCTGAPSPGAANRPMHPLNQGPAVHGQQQGQCNTPALVPRGFELAPLHSPLRWQQERLFAGGFLSTSVHSRYKKQSLNS